MKKYIAVIIAACSIPIILGLTAVVVFRKNIANTQSKNLGVGVDCILEGGLFMPQGVPFATNDPKDLKLWVNTLPTTINGQPTSAGDTSSQDQLMIGGRIVLLSAGQRAIAYKNLAVPMGRNTAMYVQLKGGVSDSRKGWVPDITVYRQEKGNITPLPM